MRRVLVLVGLLGGIAFGVSRLLKAAPGTVRSGAQRAAETVRSRGPSVAEQTAHGIEVAGELAEKGAEQARKVRSGMQEAPAEEVPGAEERSETQGAPETPSPERE
jgi:hypothetical protein